MCIYRFILLVGFATIAFQVNAQSSASSVIVLLDEDFESGTVKSVPGWGIGNQGGGVVVVSQDPVEQISKDSRSALKATYPVGNGNIYGWASFDMTPYKTDEVFVEFSAKMPNAKQGLKFLKIFGSKGTNGSGYANTTFALDYTGVATGKGTLGQIGFGDGTSIENDTQNVISFTGSNPSWIGRSFGVATVLTPEKKAFTAAEWGTEWHRFRFKVKFNSVVKNANGTFTEINDGEYYVEIDGREYVNAKGLLNRHSLNGPISKVALLDWSQNIDTSFDIWYDNIIISLGGFAPRRPLISSSNAKFN